MAIKQMQYFQEAPAPKNPPAWMPSNKGNDQIKNVSPVQNIAKKNKKDEIAPDAPTNTPVWLETGLGSAIQTAGNVIAGPAGVPNLLGGLSPYLANLLLDNMQGKRNDTLAPASPLRGRSDQLANRMLSARSDTLARRPFTNQNSDFSTYYGGYGGYGGYGYGGGGGGYGGSDYPSWMNQFLNLNNWNI